MEYSKNNFQAESEDSIDIVALLSNVWKKRKFILKTVVVFAFFGFLIAILTPNKYTASSLFIPNYGQSSSSSGGLKGLVSLAGINIGGGMSSGAREISPMLYGKIIESVTFKKELLLVPIENINEGKTLREYLKNSSTGSVFKTIKEYTIGLPAKIIGFFKTKDETHTIEFSEAIQSITLEEMEYFKTIDEMLNLTINDKEGYIELMAKCEDPLLAAQLAKKAELILQKQIITIQTKSSLGLLKYLESQFKEKKDLFNKAQDRLSNFKDSNLNISRSSFSNKQKRLEAELQTATVVFQNIVTQLEQVKLQVAKDTPVFSIVKPVVLPNEKSGPKRSLILFLCVFLGIFFSIGFVLVKGSFQNIIKDVKFRL